MTLRAVLFDWGGTLSVNAPVDLLDMWRAAARVLARRGERVVVMEAKKGERQVAAAAGVVPRRIRSRMATCLPVLIRWPGSLAQGPLQQL